MWILWMCTLRDIMSLVLCTSCSTEISNDVIRIIQYTQKAKDIITKR